MILRNSFSIFLSSVLLTIRAMLIFSPNGQRKYKESIFHIALTIFIRFYILPIKRFFFEDSYGSKISDIRGEDLPLSSLWHFLCF